MKIMVTGATGFVGAALLTYLEGFSDLSVVGLVRSREQLTKNSSTEFRLADIARINEAKVDSAILCMLVHTPRASHINNDDSPESIRRISSNKHFWNLGIGKARSKIRRQTLCISKLN